MINELLTPYLAFALERPLIMDKRKTDMEHMQLEGPSTQVLALPNKNSVNL